MMNVYMFEDNQYKQRHFLAILELAQQQAQALGIDTELKPGFGDDPENASVQSVLAPRIFEALLDPDAIYLVDLELTAESDQDVEFTDLMLAHDTPWTRQALADFDALHESDDEYVQTVCTKFPVAIRVLCYCHAAGRSAILASSDIASTYPTTVQSLNLIGRGPEISFPNNAKVAPPKMISAWSQAVVGMLDELIRLSKVTSNWFGKPYRSDWQDYDGLPHDVQSMRINQHQRIVRKVLPWAPDSWWDTDVDVSALHDCLKSSFGYDASWGSSVGERPLCLGGAYLLLLVAVAQRFPGEFSPFIVSNFRSFTKDGVPIPFLPKQFHKDAQRAVRSLYDFYCQIRVKKSGAGESMLGLAAIDEPQDGCTNFCVRLSWDKEQVQNFAAEFSARIFNGLEKDSIELPPAKASSSLIRFLLASCSREIGIGSLGTIQINKSECWIGWGSVPC